MPTILPIDASSPYLLQTRALFAQYSAFLLATKSCGTHVPKLDEETATLPDAYAKRGGEVLLALVDDQPAGCIAYRAIPDDPTSCEIKRLYVHPEFRGQHLSRALVLAAIDRARTRHFTRAILDTDIATMPQALALYLTLGFREYHRDANLAYLELRLNPDPAKAMPS